MPVEVVCGGCDHASHQVSGPNIAHPASSSNVPVDDSECLTPSSQAILVWPCIVSHQRIVLKYTSTPRWSCVWLIKAWKCANLACIRQFQKLSITEWCHNTLAHWASLTVWNLAPRMMFTACLPQHSQNPTRTNRSSGLIRNSYILKKQMIIDNSCY
jgi:hypothetical protein